jgi:hypothetical protein
MKFNMINQQDRVIWSIMVNPHCKAYMWIEIQGRCLAVDFFAEKGVPPQPFMLVPRLKRAIMALIAYYKTYLKYVALNNLYRAFLLFTTYRSTTNCI